MFRLMRPVLHTDATDKIVKEPVFIGIIPYNCRSRAVKIPTGNMKSPFLSVEPIALDRDLRAKTTKVFFQQVGLQNFQSQLVATYG